jgi:hypothetical protein
MSPRHHPSPRWRIGLWLSALALTGPRATRAEDDISYKHQEYQESGGRITVWSHSALIESALGPDLQVKLGGVIDAIAGATPDGRPAPTPGGQVPLTFMHDRRKAWNAELARQFGRVNVALGAANSRESDYVSTGGSINTLTDFNQKNTTLLLGLAGTSDDVKVFYQGPYAKKRTGEAIVGVTQLLSPVTFVTFNLTYGRATGYLGDPYRFIQKITEVVPGVFLPNAFHENRPDRREHWIGLASLNHTVVPLHGALETSYRFYRDTFGSTSHTLGATWLQKLGERFVLSPSLRYYQQSAADFYRLSLDGTTIVPGFRPNPTGPFYSADYRLAKLRTWDYGLKAVWKPADWLQLDVAFDHYEMQGRDGFTSPSAFPRARIITFGGKLLW